jgi:hypothetical protein
VGAIRQELVSTRLALIDHTDIEQRRPDELPLATATRRRSAAEVHLVTPGIATRPSEEPFRCKVAVAVFGGTLLALRIFIHFAAFGAILDILVCERFQSGGVTGVAFGLLSLFDS